MRGGKRKVKSFSRTLAIAVALSWSAGFVDAVSYLELHHLYTSHMTGNTASFASRIVEQNWPEAMRFGWTILSFLLGLLTSAALTRAERRKGIRSAFAAALVLETVLLTAFVILGRAPSTPDAILIFLPAAAMGIQTVTVTRVGSLRVYTTYLTGSLSKFSEAAAQYLFWVWDRTRGRFRSRIVKVLLVTPQQESARRAMATACLWITFFAGAVCGIAGDHSFRLWAVFLPISILAGAIAVDLCCPRSLGEPSPASRRRNAPPRPYRSETQTLRNRGS